MNTNSLPFLNPTADDNSATITKALKASPILSQVFILAFDNKKFTSMELATVLGKRNAQAYQLSLQLVSLGVFLKPNKKAFFIFNFEKYDDKTWHLLRQDAIKSAMEKEEE